MRKPENLAPDRPVDVILTPFVKFAQLASASGILLVACALAAMVWANSPWGDSYFNLWQTPVAAQFGALSLSKPLVLWVNDGLMAIFFFVVGLEIKREVLVGELRTWRKASLPVFAALGGAAVPALIYAMLNRGTEGAAGWGIPMATDIAFALGVLALLGSRVPTSLKLFLTALAIVDDIAAVLVIAVFYTDGLQTSYLAWGGVALLAMVALNVLGARSPLAYLLVGFTLWYFVLKSGVHATVAGVAAAMTIPVRSRLAIPDFVDRLQSFVDRMRASASGRPGATLSEEEQATIQAVESAAEYVQTPLQRLEHSMHPWVVFGVMPIFALANAGIDLGGNVMAAITHPVSLGVVLGLFFGKQIGITLAAVLVVKSGISELPAGVNWKHIGGVAMLGGIGFTMSLFIANLALGGTALLDSAKFGILGASIISGAGGFWLVKMACDREERLSAAQ